MTNDNANGEKNTQEQQRTRMQGNRQSAEDFQRIYYVKLHKEPTTNIE